MEACSSETTAGFQLTARRYISEDRTLHKETMFEGNMNYTGSEQGLVVYSVEYRHENSVSTEPGQFLHQLSDYQLLNKYSGLGELI
jgi:hypothetical protein